MKTSKKGILGLAATLGAGMALFAATGNAARADGDDWRYQDRYDHSDHVRYERERDQECREHHRYEEARERRIERERRDHERRDHERWERERREREHRDHSRFDVSLGSETHGDRNWR